MASDECKSQQLYHSSHEGSSIPTTTPPPFTACKCKCIFSLLSINKKGPFCIETDKTHVKVFIRFYFILHVVAVFLGHLKVIKIFSFFK